MKLQHETSQCRCKMSSVSVVEGTSQHTVPFPHQKVNLGTEKKKLHIHTDYQLLGNDKTTYIFRDCIKKIFFFKHSNPMHYISTYNILRPIFSIADGSNSQKLLQTATVVVDMPKCTYIRCVLPVN